MQKLVEEIWALIKGQADRVNALERRIAEIEARPSLEYRGIWSAEETYQLGHLVTDGGSMWFCKLHEVRSRPGHDGGIGWQLCVKRGSNGRDGKDAR